MKITKKQLKQIIREEKRILKEEFSGSMLDLDDYNSLFAAIDGIAQRYVRMGYTQEDVLHALRAIMEDFLR